MQLLDRTREGPKLTDAGRVLVSPRRGGDRAARRGRARAGRDRRARGRRAAAGQLPERQRDRAHRGGLDLPPPPPGGPAQRRRRRARGVAAAAARRRARPRADLRLPVGAEARGARPRPDPGADRVDAPGAAQGPRARRRSSVVPLAELRETEWLCGSRPSTCGEVVFRACRDAGFEPRIGFESDDYHVMQGFIAAGLGVTLLPDLALADPALRPRRAADRSAGARAPRLGRQPPGGLPLAGDRGDARDPGRGRRRVREAQRRADAWSPEPARGHAEGPAVRSQPMLGDVGRVALPSSNRGSTSPTIASSVRWITSSVCRARCIRSRWTHSRQGRPRRRRGRRARRAAARRSRPDRRRVVDEHPLDRLVAGAAEDRLDLGVGSGGPSRAASTPPGRARPRRAATRR